jgi:RHS repeat-associated protein
LKQASTTNPANTYTLVYDALSRCVKRTLNGTDTYYIYDGEKPILEYNGSGIRVGFNLYGKGIDEILERGAYGTDNAWHWCFFQQDHEGSVTHLTDAGGNIIERYRYDAFGAPSIYAANWTVRSATIYDNRFLFTGREYAATYRSTYNIPAFNFYEYRARAYNPTLGRFMSEDPKGFVHRMGYGSSSSDWSFSAHPDEGEFNLYRYCGNEPLDFTDPMGLEDFYPNAHITAYAYGRDNAYAGHANGFDHVALATDPARREAVLRNGRVVDVIQHAVLGDNSFANPSSVAAQLGSKIQLGSRVYIEGRGWFVAEDHHAKEFQGKKLDPRFDMYAGKSDINTLQRLDGRANVTVYGPKESISKEMQQKGPAVGGWPRSPSKDKLEFPHSAPVKPAP